MSAPAVGVLVAALLVAPSLASAGPVRRAATPALSSAPPHVLNIVRVKVKTSGVEAYPALEAQIARAYDRAKIRLYWLCLQSTRDPSDVLYLNFYDSPEAADRATAIYEEAIKRHPDLVALQDRLRAITQSTTSTLATRRDDVDRPATDVDFGTMRRLRLTTVQVRQGREGGFLDAIRTTPHKSGWWLVYEANDSSTYALIGLKRTAFNRRDGAAVPRSLRRFNGFAAKADTQVYTVRPAMSHVPATFLR